MTAPLAQMLAALALLGWSLHHLGQAVRQGVGPELRTLLTRRLRHRWAALAWGIGFGASVPGRWTTVTSKAWLPDGQAPPAWTRVAAAGAGLGAALHVWALWVAPAWVAALLLLLGATLVAQRGRLRLVQAGQVCVGLGLAVLAITLAREGAAEWAAPDALRAVLAALAQDIPLALVAGAAWALLLRGSPVALVPAVLLATEGVLPLPAALAFSLGVALGGAGASLRLAASRFPHAQHAAWSLLLAAAGVAGLALACWDPLVAALSGAPAATTVFGLNAGAGLAVAAAALFLPLPAPRILMALAPGLPAEMCAAALARPRGPAAPRVALSQAMRALARLADGVDAMVRDILLPLRRDDPQLARNTESLRQAIEAECVSVRTDLASLPQHDLAGDERRRWEELMAFVARLEHIADTAARLLDDLAARPAGPARKLPAAALHEITELHARLLHNLRAAFHLMLTRDPTEATQLQAAQRSFGQLACVHLSAHLARQAAGDPAATATSAWHVGLLAQLAQMNTLACAQGDHFLLLHSETKLAASPTGDPGHRTTAPVASPCRQGPSGREPAASGRRTTAVALRPT